MDLTADVTYRTFKLNDSDVQDNVTPSDDGGGITGSVIDSADFSDVDVVQFLEKRSQSDGMDAGDVFLGARRLRISGTLYGLTRALLFDSLFDLRAALSPVLAQRESPGDHGYRPMYFSVPTARLDDYSTGVIDMQIACMPRAFQAILQRQSSGGDPADALGIEWQATFVCRDPSISALNPQDYSIAPSTLVNSGVSVVDTAGYGLVTKASHGMSAGQAIYFNGLTGGTGLTSYVVYYVLAGGMTSGAFYISLSPGGSAVAITATYTAAQYVKGGTTTGTVHNRGNYLAPVEMLIEVTGVAGSISATVGDSVFTITVPASTGNRIIRFKGADKVLTVEEESVEVPRMDLLTFAGTNTWPMVASGDSAFSVTASAYVVTGSHLWFTETYA